MNRLREFRRFWGLPLGPTWLQPCPQLVSGFSTFSFCFSAVARLLLPHESLVPSENLIRWIRSRKENRIMIETDGDLLRTFARIYAGLLSFA
jgi:hypothetical protein